MKPPKTSETSVLYEPTNFDLIVMYLQVFKIRIEMSNVCGTKNHFLIP